MPVTRERVDPQRDHDALGLVHRRWIVPDDVQRPMPLQVLSRLWRGLIELRVLDGGSEVRLVRFNGEALELPAAASAGVYLRRGWIDPGIAFPVMVGVLIGSMLGARVLVGARVPWLRLLFALVLVVLGVQMIYGGLMRQF